jgi:hypothetical protein
MPKHHPLLDLARLMCDMSGVTAQLDDADADEFTAQWVLKHYDEIDACIRRREQALRGHGLYEPLTAAVAASRQLASERRGAEADLALLEISRVLLEVSGQNDLWRKQFGFGQGSGTKQ